MHFGFQFMGISRENKVVDFYNDPRVIPQALEEGVDVVRAP
jgi:hypothetical protein